MGSEISAKRSELYLFIRISNVYDSFKTLFTYMRCIQAIARRKTKKQKQPSSMKVQEKYLLKDQSFIYLFIHRSNVYNSFKTLFTYTRSIEGIARRKTRKQKLA
jgi:transcriptional regulator NrdR family protein